MASVEHDTRFNEAEADVDRGEAWRYREDGAPNPLTIRVTGLSSGHTKYGEADFMSGTDRDGKAWSVLLGAISLRKPLLEGLIERWSEETNGYEVVETIGRVQAGEVVSMRYTGDGENANGQPYPKFNVSRKPAPAQEASSQGDDIPW